MTLSLEEVVVVYPSYVVEPADKRKQFLDILRTDLHAQNLSTKIVQVLNGADPQILDELVDASESSDLDAIPSYKKGLTEALVAGYSHCISNYPGQTVVRLDTAEHDTKYVRKLAEKANEIKGHVVGDLTFADDQLEPGSADEFAHLMLFPMVSNMFLKKLSLSCAHGYAALHGSVLPRVLTGATRVASLFKEEGILPCWGFDEAMILSSVKQNVPIEISPVPAVAYRNRPSEKILAQSKNSLQMYLAAETLDW